MTTHQLLETYLRQLRLPMFLTNYRKFAEDSAQANLSYDRFLLALAELEVAQREKNHIQRGIKAARFPVTKELADFDFSAIPSLNKAKVLESANSEISLYRGALLLARKDYKGSVEVLAPYVAANPESAHGHYYMGLAQYGLKRRDKTVEHFQRFLALAPNAPEASRVESLLRSLR